jgi:molybdopterin-guanine dinucleotide biosynthesis protein A
VRMGRPETDATRFPGCSAAILAGGSSSRMGTNKALLEVGGRGMLCRTANLLRPLVDDLFLVADDATPYAGAGLPIIPDVHPGCGAVGGIHAALRHAAHPLVLCVACDMPHLARRVIELLLSSARPDDDALIPRIGRWPEPLLAVYSREAGAGFERAILAGRFKVMHALDGLRVRFVDEAELRVADPDLRSFVNVNTPGELAAARDSARQGES